MENTINSTVNETTNWLGEFLTSNSATEYAQVAAILISIFLFIGPLIGFVFVSLVWYGVPYAICFYYLMRRRRQGHDNLDLDEVRPFIFSWVRWLGRIIYDYEIIGTDNIPKEEAVMMIGYHGLLPIEFSCFIAKWKMFCPNLSYPAVIFKRNSSNSVSAKFFKECYRVFNGGAWTREELVEMLKKGQSVMISPGGGYESTHNDEMYRLHWNNHKGFAHVAVAAKVAIVPCFTINLQEAFRMPWYAEIFLQKRFVFSHMFSSVLNGFPVKLTTVCGRPIWYDENITPEELAIKSQTALQQLIDEHQRLPGNRLYAMIERFCGSRAKTSKIKHYSEDNAVENESRQPLINTV